MPIDVTTSCAVDYELARADPISTNREWLPNGSYLYVPLLLER
jgi:hypothetical protein